MEVTTKFSEVPRNGSCERRLCYAISSGPESWFGGEPSHFIVQLRPQSRRKLTRKSYKYLWHKHRGPRWCQIAMRNRIPSYRSGFGAGSQIMTEDLGALH